MSVPQGAALSALGVQFAAGLESYDQAAARLVRAPADLELYAVLARGMDTMRAYAAALPEVAVPWVELMIRHYELTHMLWRVQQGHAGAEQLLDVRGEHAAAVQFLARRLMRAMPHH